MNEWFIMLHCRLTVTLGPLITAYAVLGLCLQCHIIDSKWQFSASLSQSYFWCYVFVMFQSQASAQAATETRSQIFTIDGKRTNQEHCFLNEFPFGQNHSWKLCTTHRLASWVGQFKNSISFCETHHGYITFVLRFIKHHENNVLLRFSGGN